MKMIIESSLKLLFPTIKNIEFWATGSQIYGYPTEDSDYDIITHLSYRDQVIKVLETQNIEVTHSNYYNCIKFKFLNITINMIFLDDKNKHAWIQATTSMVAIKESICDERFNPLRDRNQRYKLFQNLVTHFGGELPTTVYEPKSRMVTGADLLTAVQKLSDSDIPF
ncbi:hypothetical protein SCRM01_286 [Synechococcus phage S-CRM01]|uniref:hypothetical protein n=1 Tax=Synechococcus phage S-CRM01 TaxID=1026955 RepID=UPI000209E31A|nr:hypothetical protein SCRM01_286 [Synechococcus phage S-CRM01]AEC53232.1 hypothetical protein SCRM01_286 [Synechococcus phage S-CRM01]